MFEPFIFFEKEIEMDTTSYNPGPNVVRAVSQEQMDIKNAIPQSLGRAVLDEIGFGTELDDGIVDNSYSEERERVPIFKLQAVEEARKLTQQFKDDADYDELVKYVQKWKTIMTGENDTMMDHRAIAVLLDDDVMFNELKRSHEALDNTYEYLTKEPNAWAKHEEMYDKLLEDIKTESSKCEEAKAILNKLM